jgi:hypothetical protein
MPERATELAGEGGRWFDLQRWGPLDNQTTVDQLKARDAQLNSFVAGNLRLRPQTNVDLLKLAQNPGYYLLGGN